MDTPTSFEWDDAKALANEAKHGVSFEAAIYVFLDDNRLDVIDSRQAYGEQRRNALGTVDGICLTVTYTMRGHMYRIISARRASRKERQCYDDHA